MLLNSVDLKIHCAVFSLIFKFGFIYIHIYVYIFEISSLPSPLLPPIASQIYGLLLSYVHICVYIYIINDKYIYIIYIYTHSI